MYTTHTIFDEVKIIHLDIFEDKRGFFTERFNAKKFAEIGIPTNYVQDNHSFSSFGVLRGLHFQIDPSQGKLVSCLSGKIFDVIVDVRKDSKTFGKYCSIELSYEKVLWIPGGFAHGFCVISNEGANVSYKVDCLYNPGKEHGIRFDSKDISINWPIANPIVSEKDLRLGKLVDFK